MQHDETRSERTQRRQRVTGRCKRVFPLPSGTWLEVSGIVAILIIASLPYLCRLGFYGDDWALLSGFAEFQKSHVLVLPDKSILHDFEPRPMHGLWSYLLFLCFGFDPLPYHLVNLAVLSASLLLTWRLLREFSTTRPFSFQIVALYALLPQLSTAKVWFAAYCVTISQLFLLLGMSASLQWVRRGKWHWKIVALACWSVSVLSYELFIPLIAATAISVAWARRRRMVTPQVTSILGFLPEFLDMLIIVAAFAFKSFVSARATPLAPRYIASIFASRTYYPPTDFGLNAKQAVIVNFWASLSKPVAAVAALPTSADLVPRLSCAVVVAVIVFLLSRRVSPAGPNSASRLMMFGAGVFWLGFGIFALTTQISITPAGVGNRTAVAAAFGVAMIAAGAVAAASRLVPDGARRLTTAAVAAVACFALAIRSSEVDGHWAEAYRQELRLVRRARTDLARLPANSTVIVRGVCPYVGPAIVLEASWDAQGLLGSALGGRGVVDVFSPTTTLTRTVLHTSVYGQTQSYPFSDRLFLYDAGHRSFAALPDRDAAERAMTGYRTEPRSPACPPGFPGHGVPI